MSRYVMDVRVRVALPQEGQNFSVGFLQSLDQVEERGDQYFITARSLARAARTHLKQAWHRRTQVRTCLTCKPSGPRAVRPICMSTFCMA